MQSKKKQTQLQDGRQIHTLYVPVIARGNFRKSVIVIMSQECLHDHGLPCNSKTGINSYATMVP